LSVGPGGGIGPPFLPGRRRSGILCLNDHEEAAEHECWKEQSKKEPAMVRTHRINPPYWKMTEKRSGKSVARSGAQQTSGPERVADFRPAFDFRIPTERKRALDAFAAAR
jgi:hypothetical protein